MAYADLQRDVTSTPVVQPTNVPDAHAFCYFFRVQGGAQPQQFHVMFSLEDDAGNEAFKVLTLGSGISEYMQLEAFSATAKILDIPSGTTLPLEGADTYGAVYVRGNEGFLRIGRVQQSFTFAKSEMRPATRVRVGNRLSGDRAWSGPIELTEWSGIISSADFDAEIVRLEATLRPTIVTDLAPQDVYEETYSFDMSASDAIPITLLRYRAGGGAWTTGDPAGFTASLTLVGNAATLIEIEATNDVGGVTTTEATVTYLPPAEVTLDETFGVDNA